MRILHKPRKAYCLSALPRYFDILNYYGFITKTAVLNQDFNEFYKDLNLPTGRLEERMKQSILATLAEENVTNFDELDNRAITRLLTRFVDDALCSLPEKSKKFAEFRVSIILKENLLLFYF